MKTVIIGGTGHIGSFLTQMLAEDGHDVLVISTGRTASHTKTHSDKVRLVQMRYSEMLTPGLDGPEPLDGPGHPCPGPSSSDIHVRHQFAKLLREERPGTVVDILQGDTAAVYDACRNSGVGHLIVCGSVWMFGRPKVVPTPEVTQTECEFVGYAQRYASILETLGRSRADGYAFTAIMPPNICGPGKIPLDGEGGRSIDVHRAHQRGEKVVLPYPGTNLIGPCDAEDVARGFFCAMNNRAAAANEIFNVGSAYALTSEKFIHTYAAVYGSKIPIEYVSPEKYLTDVSPDPGASFHFMEHMCPDISKISSRLGYQPAYTPEQTMERAVRWMFDAGLLSQP